MVTVVEDLLKANKETNFKYMWINKNTQSQFVSLFGLESTPKLVIFSHGKRKKFLIHEGEFSAKDIRKILKYSC